MKRGTVYICHPYAGDPEGNRQKVLLICKDFVRCGLLPIAPQVYLPQFIDEETQRDVALEMCLRLLTLCDVVAICGEKVRTAGMTTEIALALRLEIPAGILTDKAISDILAGRTGVAKEIGS